MGFSGDGPLQYGVNLVVTKAKNSGMKRSEKSADRSTAVTRPPAQAAASAAASAPVSPAPAAPAAPKKGCAMRLWGWFLALYFLVIAAIHLFGLGGESYGIIVTVISFLTPLFAIGAGISVVSLFGIRTATSKAVLWITAGIVLWLLGDISWSLLGEPEVSIADIFWLVGYLPIFIGAFYGISAVKSGFLKEGKNIGIATVVTLLAGIPLVLLTKAFLWEPGLGFVDAVVSIGYVVADVFLLVPVVLIIVQAFTGLFSKPWIIVGLGTLIYLVGDILYVVNVETYEGGSLIDLWWYGGYLLFAAGFLLLRAKTEELLAA